MTMYQLGNDKPNKGERIAIWAAGIFAVALAIGSLYITAHFVIKYW